MKIQTDFDYLIKIALFGDSQVGKTNMVIRFIDNVFSLNTPTTLGYDYKSKNLTIDKKVVKLQIWDTAGQERYMSLNKTVFQKVDGVMLVYDITERESFNNIVKWIDLIKEFNDNLPIILIGNKTDLEDRVVDPLEGKNLAKEYNIDFYETSALNGENIEKVFREFTIIVLNSLKVKEKVVSENFSIKKEKTGKKKSHRCC